MMLNVVSQMRIATFRGVVAEGSNEQRRMWDDVKAMILVDGRDSFEGEREVVSPEDGETFRPPEWEDKWYERNDPDFTVGR